MATRAGSVGDPNGKAGLAAMTNRVMRRGTKTRNAIQIDETLGNLGTGLFGGAGKESASMNLEVLKRNLNESLAVMSDVVLNPTFPADEFDRAKKQTLDGLAQAANNPNSVANRVAYMLAFGADHPYGRPSGGLPKTVEAITRDDLQQFYQTYWKPASSALVFVGDISLAEATNLARQNFGSWSGGSAPAVTYSGIETDAAAERFISLTDRARRRRLLLKFFPRRRENLPIITRSTLANAVYGGGFGTRLNLNLREDKGYSYGVFAFPQHFSKGGTWIASGGVQTDKTKESAVEFMKELKFIAGEKPISAEELSTARLSRIRGYAQQFESYGRIAEQITDLWTAGLPMTNLQKETDELAKLQLGNVNSIAAKYAAPAGTTILLVGDLSKIEAGIRELNLGEIVILDVEGNPVKK